MARKRKKVRTSMYLDPLIVGGLKLLKKHAIIENSSGFMNDLVLQLMSNLANTLMVEEEEVHAMALEMFDDDRREEYKPRVFKEVEIIEKNPLIAPLKDVDDMTDEEFESLRQRVVYGLVIEDDEQQEKFSLRLRKFIAKKEAEERAKKEDY